MNERRRFSPGWSGRCSRRRVGACVATALALAGCTIFNPVPRSDEDRRFPRGKPIDVQEVDAGKSPDAFCEGQACVEPPDRMRDYYGGLGVALWSADQERLALNRDGMERTRLNSTFNALTWPVVAWAGAKKLREPDWSVRDAVAIGFALYKLLGEGVPERDRIYLQTANRVACSMFAAEALLYLVPGRGGSEIEFELVTLVPDLSGKLDSYELARGDLVGKLVLAPVSAKKPHDALHALRREALGLANGASTVDPVTPMLAAFDQSFKAGNVTLGEARAAKSMVELAASTLKWQVARFKQAMKMELQGRAPPQRDPLSGASEFMDVLEKAVAKQVAAASTAASAKAQSRSTGSSQAPWEPTPARLKGLTDPAGQEVKKFWAGNEIPLRISRRKTQDWLVLHQRRLAALRTEANSLGCGPKDINDFIAELARKASATPSSGADTGSSNGPATNPSTGTTAGGTTGNTPAEGPIPTPGSTP